MTSLEGRGAQHDRHDQKDGERVADTAREQQQQAQLEDVEAQLQGRLPLPQHALRRQGQDQGQVEQDGQGDHPQAGQERHLEAQQETRRQQSQHLSAHRRPAQAHQGAQPEALPRRAAALPPGGAGPIEAGSGVWRGQGHGCGCGSLKCGEATTR